MTANPQQSAPRRRPRSLKTTLFLAGLLVGYALLQPKLEQWFGDERPAAGNDPVVHSDAPLVDAAEELQTRDGEHTAAAPSRNGDQGTPPGDWPRQADSATGRETDASAATTTESATAKLGELRDIGGGVFQSTAGLHYRPGSQEGHRIKHILRHHEDDPDRPVHGVFDGDRNEVFAVIDEAYLYTFDHGPPRVTTEKDDGRTIFRVDLGRRIGFVGGQSGRRQNHPEARHVQLILDGTDVITAYPIRVRQRRE